MFYKVEGYKIQLFDPLFVKKNRHHYILIIKNRKFPLISEIFIRDKSTKFLEVKLIFLNKTRKKINLSGMFYNCSSLKNFCIVSNPEENESKNISEIEKNSEEELITKSQKGIHNFSNENNGGGNNIFKNFSKNDCNIKEEKSYDCVYEEDDYYENNLEDKIKQFSCLNNNPNSVTSNSLNADYYENNLEDKSEQFPV